MVASEGRQIPMNLDLPKITAALPKWEADREALFNELDKVRTKKQFVKWEAREKANDDLLRSAFADDTSDRNSRSTCMMIPAADIAHLAKSGKWK